MMRRDEERKCISPQSPLFPQPAFLCPVLDQQTVDVEKQAHNLSRTTSQISRPQPLPAEGGKLENALSAPLLAEPVSLLLLGGSPIHPYAQCTAARAVTKIDRLFRKQWRLCQASPWWRWRPGSIPVSRTSTSTFFWFADMYITDTHDPRHQEAFQKSPS